MTVWWLDLQLPVQSASVTTDTKVVYSNHVHVQVNSLHHYVIKFVSDLWQVRTLLRFPLRYNWNIVESGVRHHKQQPSILNAWYQNVCCQEIDQYRLLSLLRVPSDTRFYQGDRIRQSSTCRGKWLILVMLWSRDLQKDTPILTKQSPVYAYLYLHHMP